VVGACLNKGRKKVSRPWVTFRDLIGTTMLSFAGEPPEATIAQSRRSLVPKIMLRTSPTIFVVGLRTSTLIISSALRLGTSPGVRCAAYLGEECSLGPAGHAHLNHIAGLEISVPKNDMELTGRSH
jgi:hypothetical protein